MSKNRQHNQTQNQQQNKSLADAFANSIPATAVEPQVIAGDQVTPADTSAPQQPAAVEKAVTWDQIDPVPKLFPPANRAAEMEAEAKPLRGADSPITKIEEPAFTPGPVARRGETHAVVHYDDAAFVPAPTFSRNVEAKFEFLDNYLVAMRPKKPIHVRDMLVHQANLWGAISGLLNQTTDPFDKVFARLLSYFDTTEKTAFHPDYVFRGASDVNLSPEDLRAFQQITQMLIDLGPRASRGAMMRQVDLTKVLRHGVTEQSRQRIRAFFGQN